jgi:hypothetical protein
VVLCGQFTFLIYGNIIKPLEDQNVAGHDYYMQYIQEYGNVFTIIDIGL